MGLEGRWCVRGSPDGDRRREGTGPLPARCEEPSDKQQWGAVSGVKA